MYIIPSTFMDNKFEENVREMLLSNGSIKLVHELDDSIFESACVHSMILGASSKIIGNDYFIKVSTSLNFNDNKDLIPASFFLKQQFKSIAIRAYKNKDFINKINHNSLPLYKVLDVRQAIKSGNDKKYISNEKLNDEWKPILGGKHINKYFLRNPKLYLLYGNHLACPRDKNIFEQPKLLIREAGDRIIATYDDSNFYIMSSLYNAILINDSFYLKYLLALLNSSVFLFLMKLLTFDKTKGAFTKAKIFHYYELPIKVIEKAKQKIICDLVDKVIYLKSKDKDSTLLEQQIDNLVFKLYQLSYDEVKVIDSEFGLSEEEYNNLKIE
jgi:adenine-specific DNA-methyltransferase